MFEQTQKHGLTWINLENPTQDDITKIKKNCPLHPLDVEDVFSATQRPKITQHSDYLFLVFHFPIYNHQAQAIRSEEIDIFLGPNYLITIHAGKIFTLKKYFQDCQRSASDEKRCFGRGPAFLLYQITKELLNRSFPMLDNIARDIDRIEDQMFDGREKRTVREISIVQRNILNFRRIFSPQRNVLNSLAVLKHPLLKDFDIYYKSLDNYSDRIWDILENQLETISAWTYTNSCLISFKQSAVMQIITIFSFVAIPALIIVQIYSRSVPTLPGESWPYTIWIIIGALLVFIVSALIAFARRKWL